MELTPIGLVKSTAHGFFLRRQGRAKNSFNIDNSITYIEFYCTGFATGSYINNLLTRKIMVYDSIKINIYYLKQR
ncbi:MAG: hypothetical protein PHI97_23910, partial [Desulfobulbus sp.]|nr:hypothetical protein [Desulfobulbus sp.]